jgi:hypothetical protein
MYFEKIIEAKRVGSIASAAGSMSALPPKSGHWNSVRDVRFVPIADIQAAVGYAC